MSFSQKSEILSVTELSQSIKTVLELQYRFIHVRGEISNLRIPYSGHIYFTLKDAASQIRAVLFKGQQKYLVGELKEGQSIVCHGRLSVYEPRGEYQVIIDTVDLDGTGNLQIQFEQLKEKLKNEGLFNVEHKRNIPVFPEKIALITSPTGAAVHDFLKVMVQRNYWGTIVIIPVTVQGRNSSAEIAEAIEFACNNSLAEILVLIRGGGSIEDLWSFNEENTARAIHHASLPVVTGIGHDTDFTIADMCADLHAHTPTAVAEAIIPDGRQLIQSIESYRSSLLLEMVGEIESKQQTIHTQLRLIGNLDLFLSNHDLRLDYQLSALINAYRQRIMQSAVMVGEVVDKLHTQAPLNRIALQEQKVEHLRNNIMRAIDHALEKKRDVFSRQVALLDSVSPLSILSRGYSIVSKPSAGRNAAEVISSADQVVRGDVVDVLLHHGKLECQILQRKNGN